MSARRAPRAIGAALAQESLPVVVYSAFLGLLAVLVPQLLASDGWLALVGGRLVLTSYRGEVNALDPATGREAAAGPGPGAAGAHS